MRRLEMLYRRLATQGASGIGEAILLALLAPLGWLYGLAGLIRVVLYRLKVLPSFRPRIPVVSVGNLTVGGTGKTPTVDWVVRYYLGCGCRVAVVSRGYGGSGTSGVTVVCAGHGPLVDPVVCGDEPFLLARRNPGAVILVAPRRAEGVRVAEEDYGVDVVVLDDGFQHLAVQRDLDMVLLDARRPLGNGRVLPAGLLREFPVALRRAGFFLLTRCGSIEEDPAISLPRPVLRSRHELSDELVALDGQTLPLRALAGKKGVAFAGIADPEGFFRDLVASGLTLQKSLPFGDHAGYGPRELEQITQAAAAADFLITTEKDGVKLRTQRFAVPCYQVSLQLHIFEPGRLEERLNALLPGGKHGSCQGTA